MRVLPMQIDEPLAKLAQLRERRGTAVDPCAASSLCINHAAQQHVAVGDHRLFGEPCDRRGRVDHIEFGREFGALGAGTQLPQLEAVAEEEREGVEENRFPGACFAGQHGKARVEFDVERFDDDEIANREKPEHSFVALALAAYALGRFAPVELLAQHRDVIVIVWVEQARAMLGAPQRDAIAFGQIEVRLPVAMDRRIATMADGNGDERAVGNCDGTMRERVWRDGNERERRDLRRNDRTAGRQRIGGRTRRRRDDDAVGAHRIDETSVDFDGEVDHRSECAAIDDDVVQCQRMLPRSVGALNGGIDQRAPLFDVAAIEHCAQHGLHSCERNIGQKAETPLVDTDQRHVAGSELSRERQHRAVAPQHDRKICGAAERRGFDGGEFRLHCERRGFGFERDAVAAIDQESRQPNEWLRERGTAGSSDQYDAGKTCG